MFTATPYCLVCGETLDARFVWCTDCQTPTHRDCFTKNGCCPNSACQGMRFRETYDRQDRGVTLVAAKDEDGNSATQTIFLDFTSRREQFAFVPIAVGFGLFLFSFSLILRPKGHLGPFYPMWTEFYGLLFTALFLAIIGVVIYKSLDDYRIVDAKTKTIWMHRRFLWKTSLTAAVTFNQCQELVLSFSDSRVHKSERWQRRWKLWLVLKDETAISLTDETTSFMGSPSVKPVPEHNLEQTAQGIATLVRIPRRTVQDYRRPKFRVF